MKSLRVITSAAYIDQELAAEFGYIPPSFLPIGVTRLYEAQIAKLGSSHVFMTLPESFSIPDFDAKRLEDLGVTVVPVPDGLRLGESVLYAINYIAPPTTAVIKILHGDTLIEDLPDDDGNVFAVSSEGDDYSWASTTMADGKVAALEVVSAGEAQNPSQPVACGYFSFANAPQLIRALTRSRGDFVTALNIYCQQISVEARHVECWRDFGHIQTYFKSRRAISTARAFNSLKISSFAVSKSSMDKAKMRAEINWLQSVPPELAPYSARLLSSGESADDAFYETQYEYAPTLSELYVFSSIGRPTWRNILRSCQDFLSICATVKRPDSGDRTLQDLVTSKTEDRLETYAKASGFDIDKPTLFNGSPTPSLRQVSQNILPLIDFASGRSEAIMHGDFCLSNILFNSRAGKIVVIDPRGYVKTNENSLFGDTRYDLAKLSHSIFGLYDHILAGRYDLERPDSHTFSLSFDARPDQNWLTDAFGEFSVDGIEAGGAEIRAITVCLFLSMLPLHADRPDRQQAFIANALRLYTHLERSSQ